MQAHIQIRNYVRGLGFRLLIMCKRLPELYSRSAIYYILYRHVSTIELYVRFLAFERVSLSKCVHFRPVLFIERHHASETN